ncbi:MAG: EndoU domain-containing protein [Pyrinomonadaceae bacterium]
MQEQIISEQGRVRIFEGQAIPQNMRDGVVHHYMMRGFHLEDPAVVAARGHIIYEDTRTSPDSRGIYRATVLMYGRKRRDGSAFFPRDWTREQVARAIAQAYANREPYKWGEFVNCYRGTTETGMRIVMELDRDGLVLDAFPRRAKLHQGREALWRIERGYQKRSRYVCAKCRSIKTLCCPHGHNAPAKRRVLINSIRRVVGRWLSQKHWSNGGMKI